MILVFLTRRFMLACIDNIECMSDYTIFILMYSFALVSVQLLVVIDFPWF